MVAGHGNGLLKGGPFPIGDVICFEVAYDELVRSSVQAGAQFLVIQTNNATFGRTGEAYQQLAMSQLRAVEHGRAVAQVSTTGVSALIGPDGQIRQRTGALFTPGILVGSMPLRTSTTLATQLGAIPEYVLAGITVLALGWSIWVARATRRDAERAAGEDQAPETEEMVTA
jgi:apolipoprotein N-acyltransferase